MSDNWSRVEKWAVILVLCGSVGMNVVLARRTSRPQGAPAAPAYLAAGEPAPPLKVQDLSSGKDVVLDFKAAPVATVLYVMSPSCPWCARNRPNVEALAAATASRFRWVAVAPLAEGMKEYVSRTPFKFESFLATAETRTSYRMRTLPETIVIDRSGVILQNWGGAYAGETQTDVERYFEVKLPGLLSAEAAKAQK